jgi:hypothetical protein
MHNTSCPCGTYASATVPRERLPRRRPGVPRDGSKHGPDDALTAARETGRLDCRPDFLSQASGRKTPVIRRVGA